MLAPQNQQFTVLDSIESTQSAWYDEIDSAIRRSDIIPGDYEYTSATSYGNTGDIEEGASTYVDLAPPRFKIISLDNSYITMTLQVPISFNAVMSNHTVSKIWYVGFKYAPEAIGAYRIHTNTDLLQTVNHANYEWFMIQNSVSDDVKEKDECYATLDKIRRMDPNVPGVYVDLTSYGAADAEFNVNIDLKIPISSFLIFYNLKYFAEWMGKICIEIYPSFRNLVVAPVINPDAGVNSTVPYTKTGGNLKNIPISEIAGILPTLNLGFYNVNQDMYNNLDLTGSNSDYPVVGNPIKCVARTCIAKSVQIRTAQYMLQADVYDAIAQRYMTRPLVFPIQEIESKDFTQNLRAIAGKADATHTHEMGDIYKNIIVQNQDETETTITKTLDEYIIEREDAIKALINAKANSNHTHNATEIIYKAAEGNNAAVNVKQELDNINQQLDIFHSQGQKVDILSVLFGVGASVGAVIDGGLVAAVGTLQNEIAVLQGEVATLGAEGLTSDVMDAVDSAGDVIQGGSSIWDGIKGIANAWSKFRTAAKGYINLSSIEALPLEDIPLA